MSIRFRCNFCGESVDTELENGKPMPQFWVYDSNENFKFACPKCKTKRETCSDPAFVYKEIK